jgi:hypothetical protein
MTGAVLTGVLPVSSSPSATLAASLHPGEIMFDGRRGGIIKIGQGL